MTPPPPPPSHAFVICLAASPHTPPSPRRHSQPQNLEAPPGEMGQDLSCNRRSLEGQFFAAARSGEVEATESILCKDPTFIHRTTAYSRSSSLHIAAAKGQVQVRLSPLRLRSKVILILTSRSGSVLQMLSLLLERWHNPDIHNRHKQVTSFRKNPFFFFLEDF